VTDRLYSSHRADVKWITQIRQFSYLLFHRLQQSHHSSFDHHGDIPPEVGCPSMWQYCRSVGYHLSWRHYLRVATSVDRISMCRHHVPLRSTAIGDDCRPLPDRLWPTSLIHRYVHSAVEYWTCMTSSIFMISRDQLCRALPRGEQLVLKAAILTQHYTTWVKDIKKTMCKYDLCFRWNFLFSISLFFAATLNWKIR